MFASSTEGIPSPFSLARKGIYFEIHLKKKLTDLF